MSELEKVTPFPVKHPKTLPPVIQSDQAQVKAKETKVERLLAPTCFEFSLHSWKKPVSTTYLADLDLSLHSKFTLPLEDTPPQPWFGNRSKQLLRT